MKSCVVRLHGQKKTDFDICADQPEHNMSLGHEHNLFNILFYSPVIQIASFKFKFLNGLCRFVKLKQGETDFSICDPNIFFLSQSEPFQVPQSSLWHMHIVLCWPISKYVVQLSDQLSGPQAKTSCHSVCIGFKHKSCEIKTNGKDHNRIFGPDKKGHFKIRFFGPNKIGILKFQSVWAKRNWSKTEFYKTISTPATEIKDNKINVLPFETPKSLKNLGWKWCKIGK